MEWKPATIEEVKDIVQRDLAECDVEQQETFRRYAVEPYFTSIQRYGNLDNVVVVARKENEVIYWEDVEEGFSVSPLAEDGRILSIGAIKTNSVSPSTPGSTTGRARRSWALLSQLNKSSALTRS